MKLTIISSLFLILLICKKVNKGQIHGISQENFNCLKGIMAIAVVLHHLSFKVHIDIFRELFIDFGSVAVGCFFFISGYGLLSSYKIKGYRYLNGFLLKRFRKLIMPFLVVILLFQIINKESWSITECLSTGQVDYLLPYSWYIFCSVIFYFVFYILFKFIRNVDINIFLIFLFTVILICFFRAIGWPTYWWRSLLLFPMGFLYKRIEKVFIDRKNFYFIVAILSIDIIIILIRFFDISDAEFIRKDLEPLIFILPLATLNLSSKYLRYLGSISYEIYLIQGIVFYLLQNLVKDNIAYISLSIISIIILSQIIKYALDKLDYLLYER